MNHYINLFNLDSINKGGFWFLLTEDFLFTAGIPFEYRSKVTAVNKSMLVHKIFPKDPTDGRSKFPETKYYFVIIENDVLHVLDLSKKDISHEISLNLVEYLKAFRSIPNRCHFSRLWGGRWEFKFVIHEKYDEFTLSFNPTEKGFIADDFPEWGFPNSNIPEETLENEIPKKSKKEFAMEKTNLKVNESKNNGLMKFVSVKSK
jgi:hypothetical protein